MIEALRKHLVLLYTCVTGCILTVVVLTVALITFQSTQQKNDQLFTNQLMAIYQKLQYDNSISYDWLNAMELENGLIISIAENGLPLLYSGAYQTDTDREILISRLTASSAREQDRLSTPPLSSPMIQTPLLSLRGNHHDSYRGTILSFSSRNSSYSITLLKDQAEINRTRLFQTAALLLADLGGVLCLFFANRKLVEHSLTPIRENEKKQQAFLAAASHELRSPLTVIQTSAQAAISDRESGDFFLQTILRECRRMSRLVQDMLLLTSAKTRGWQLNMEELDMDTLLLNLYESYMPLCKTHNTSLTLELPECPLPHLPGDRERMTQIFSILLDNALAHSHTTAPLTLAAVVQKHRLILSVTDHGVGIPPKSQAHIFEAFYRADESRLDKQHFGLGLNVATELARRQGGQICLKDTPGGGCTFCVEFPIHPIGQMNKDIKNQEPSGSRS